MDDQPDFDSPAEPSAPDAPLFQHPEWMVGIVLVCGGLAFVAGLADPVWWIIGSPAILALAVWAWGRIRSSRRDTEV